MKPNQDCSQRIACRNGDASAGNTLQVLDQALICIEQLDSAGLLQLQKRVPHAGAHILPSRNCGLSRGTASEPVISLALLK